MKYVVPILALAMAATAAPTTPAYLVPKPHNGTSLAADNNTNKTVMTLRNIDSDMTADDFLQSLVGASAGGPSKDYIHEQRNCIRACALQNCLSACEKNWGCFRHYCIPRCAAECDSMYNSRN
ncbi:hypothetical protein QBC35DRAFT_125216 [Podospora australis]|uniref:Uncharacterized protein n=1 Tax=Podospora australis TaxID=1536484 RepID=A0AAN7AER2_9PEZI|nr:hypothetical protein QBC35DRAFT_125216 [Podospora australis]